MLYIFYNKKIHTKKLLVLLYKPPSSTSFRHVNVREYNIGWFSNCFNRVDLEVVLSPYHFQRR